jgi:hypothetical protein
MIGEWWIGKDSEESSAGFIEILSLNLSEGTEENHEKPVRIAGVPAEIRTDHIPNKRLERYQYDTALSANNIN